MTNYSVPAVVLHATHHGGLGIVRTLGRLGVPVYCAGPAWEPAFHSRYCRGDFHLDIREEQAVEQLDAIGRKLGGRPLLIATTDTTAIWTAEHAAGLQTFRFPRLDPALVQTLCDKGRMQELARQSGVATVRSVAPQSREDVEQFLDTVPLPVMMKATDAGRMRRRTGGTKFIVQTHTELMNLYAKAADAGSDPCFLIQELIPGDDWMFDGYFDEGSRCLFGITGRKIRRFPVNTGITSLGICLRNPVVERTTAEFMRAIGYRGILDIGYRRDSRDGQYKVLDVNPRIGCTFRLFAAANDLDVARVLYLHMTDQPVGRTEIVEGRRWIVEDFDTISALRSVFAGTLSLKEWLRSLRGIEERACFAADDPLPFLLMGAADCCDFWRWLRFRRQARSSQSSESSDSSLQFGA